MTARRSPSSLFLYLSVSLYLSTSPPCSPPFRHPKGDDTDRNSCQLMGGICSAPHLFPRIRTSRSRRLNEPEPVVAQLPSLPPPSFLSMLRQPTPLLY